MNSTQGEVKLSSFCKDCGCILSAKVRSEDSDCPQKKWDIIKKDGD